MVRQAAQTRPRAVIPTSSKPVATITSARRQNLQALGLERVSKELDLTTYLARKTADVESQATNGEQSDPQAVSDGEVAAEANHATLPADGASRASRGNEGGELEVSPGPPAVVLNSDSTERPNGANDGERS